MVGINIPNVLILVHRTEDLKGLSSEHSIIRINIDDNVILPTKLLRPKIHVSERTNSLQVVYDLHPIFDPWIFIIHKCVDLFS